MSLEFSAYFDGRVFVPDQPVMLPVGQKLQLRVDLPATQSGQYATLADFAADLPDSPGGLSVQHDHYLYGTPRR